MFFFANPRTQVKSWMYLTQKVVCAAKHEKQQAIADCGCPLADALRETAKKS
jgi:hypothetical protein